MPKLPINHVNIPLQINIPVKYPEICYPQRQESKYFHNKPSLITHETEAIASWIIYLPPLARFKLGLVRLLPALVHPPGDVEGCAPIAGGFFCKVLWLANWKLGSSGRSADHSQISGGNFQFTKQYSLWQAVIIASIKQYKLQWPLAQTIQCFILWVVLNT